MVIDRHSNTKNDLTTRLQGCACINGKFSSRRGQIPIQKIGLTTTCMAAQNDERIIGLRGFEIKYTPSYGN